MNRIIGGNDKALEEGYKDHKHRIDSMAFKMHVNPKQGTAPPVYARIDHGRWLADCECGGCEYVEEGQPFLCFSCGNSRDSSRFRPVIFPKPAEKKLIEKTLLEREVVLAPGLKLSQRIMHARPVHGVA